MEGLATDSFRAESCVPVVTSTNTLLQVVSPEVANPHPTKIIGCTSADTSTWQMATRLIPCRTHSVIISLPTSRAYLDTKCTGRNTIHNLLCSHAQVCKVITLPPIHTTRFDALKMQHNISNQSIPS